MTQETTQIERVHVKGFKSILDAEVSLGSLNVVIGANGAGKSNLVAYFEFLRDALDAGLDGHVGRRGGPNAFLHLGAKHTQEITGVLTVNTEGGRGTLYQRVEFQAPDTLIYSRNHAQALPGVDRSSEMVIDDLCSVISEGGSSHPQQLIYFRMKDGISVFHFHDTTVTSQIRSAGYIEDNRQLQTDGGNLAAVLFLFKKTAPATYQRIVRAVRQIMPQFDDFDLEPQRLNPKNILLNWKQKGSSYLFGPHQLSDGTLRAMALITLLLQPKSNLPRLIVIDEPELGLHPHAVELIAGLIRSAAVERQVIVATQSPALVEHFEPSEIIVVEFNDGNSVYRHLDARALEDWLADYTLGELWEKNVLGGGPLA